MTGGRFSVHNSKYKKNLPTACLTPLPKFIIIYTRIAKQGCHRALKDFNKKKGKENETGRQKNSRKIEKGDT